MTASPGTAGLTTAEVEERRAAGDTNVQPTRSSRSYADIVRGNVLTRFNAIITVLAIVVLAVGDPIDAIFAVVMVVNTAIGILQEVRAKRTLDHLQILMTPSITAVRDGADVRLPPSELVTGDVVRLVAGDQVPVDGEVVESAGLEVDESALTGESDPIAKAQGETVRSGSIAVAGSALVRATAVGERTWIHELLTQAKQFGMATSELRRGVDTILTWVSWVIVPIAALLLWSQLRDDAAVRPGLVSAVAGVVGLVPQGLVLLVSAALAVAVLRLARSEVVVQELHAVEGLARIDVLCVDKTGTLTTGAMTLDRVDVLGDTADEATVRSALGALAQADPNPTATLTAAATDAEVPGWTCRAHVPFDSARKWSGGTFEPGGTWIFGAPEVLLATIGGGDRAVQDRMAEHTSDARRVVLVATAPGDLDAGDPAVPADLLPVALVVLAEELRGDAADTMRYFADHGVIVKIISGDNPATVGAVAGRLGVAGADALLDLRDVDLDGGGEGGAAEIERLVTGTTVFGRVQPQQKRRLVEILQAQGHTVAMTGDGVNDIPALKQADIAIAQNTATAATKAVSQLVLLDGRFDRMPGVVAEGRRVITNMERVSSLFVTKTVYAAAFAIVIGVWGAAFPFLPRHLSLVSETTIGIPAFALSFRSADRPYRPGYLRRVLRFAIPAGVVTAAVVLVGYVLVREATGATLEEARTASTLLLLGVALWMLRLVMRPVDRTDALILGAMVALAVAVVATPFGRRFYALDLLPWSDALMLVGYGVAVLAVATVVVGVVSRTAATRR